jgi:hypothetical protein
MESKNGIVLATGATRYRSHGVVSQDPDELATRQVFRTIDRQPVAEV